MNRKIVLGVFTVAAIAIGFSGGYIKFDSFSFLGSTHTNSAKVFKKFPQPIPLKPIELTDQNNNEFTNQQFKGHWTLAFLGYTFCPDICPLTLTGLARVYPELQALDTSDPIQILFISVDPNRDTQKRLHEYINYFNPAFIAATGPHKDLFPMVRDMRMMYAVADSTNNPNYFVDHSASVVVINPMGQAIGRFKPKLKAGQPAVVDAQQILLDMPSVIDGTL